MRDAHIVYDNFVDTVAKNRGLMVSEVKDMADGSMVLGDEAKNLHLIDAIGGIDEVTAYLSDTIGSTPRICFE